VALSFKSVGFHLRPGKKNIVRLEGVDFTSVRSIKISDSAAAFEPDTFEPSKDQALTHGKFSVEESGKFIRFVTKPNVHPEAREGDGTLTVTLTPMTVGAAPMEHKIPSNYTQEVP
jgi:hypothetical protein